MGPDYESKCTEGVIGCCCGNGGFLLLVRKWYILLTGPYRLVVGSEYSVFSRRRLGRLHMYISFYSFYKLLLRLSVRLTAVTVQLSLEIGIQADIDQCIANGV